MKQAIYGTDNSLNKKHAEDLEKYKDMINLKEINFINETIDEIKLIMFECLLHAADISNPTRYKDLFIYFSDKLNEEFCEQSKEIHSIDQTKEIDCVGNDDKKFKNQIYLLLIMLLMYFLNLFVMYLNN